MNKISLSISTILIGACIFLFSACTDDPLQVGLEVLPEVDQLNAQADTLFLNCFTMRGIGGYSAAPYSLTVTITDAVKTADNAPIGHVIDKIFGETHAEPVIELAYNSLDYYGHDSIEVTDKFVSCKLYLKLDDGVPFGGASGKFDVDMYPLTKFLPAYDYSTNNVLKSEQFEYNNKVSTKTDHNVTLSTNQISGLDTGNYLVITLDEAYASKLMEPTTDKTKSMYYSLSNFLGKIPGFYLKTHAVDGKGAIVNFHYFKSKMVLEFDRTLKTKISKADSTAKRSATFSINDYQCLDNFNYNNVELKPQIDDTINQNSNFYVQSMGGLRGYVKISGLDQFKVKNQGKVGINLAELVFPIDPENIDTTEFLMPSRLSVEYFYNSTLGASIGRDDNIGASYFNGFFNKEKMEYRINITDFIHNYVQGNHSYSSFYLNAAVFENAKSSRVEYKKPGRVILNSNENNNRSFLRIIYTSTAL